MPWKRISRFDHVEKFSNVKFFFQTLTCNKNRNHRNWNFKLFSLQYNSVLFMKFLSLYHVQYAILKFFQSLNMKNLDPETYMNNMLLLILLTSLARWWKSNLNLFSNQILYQKSYSTKYKLNAILHCTKR